MMPILVKYIDDKNIRTKHNKAFVFLFALLTATMLLMTNVEAQQTVQHEVIEDIQLNQAELDQILAPIALYPDSLLSQILVASTYPLEVVQATRWRQANSALDENQVLSAVENENWDPSVKALAPFEDLLVRISEDLVWLQSVGDAFLQNEDQVLASVQNLRQVAYDNGSIEDNDYYQVSTQDDNIIIESTQREIVYVPYYDTRVVYGNWWWDGYGPTYWHRPRNYVHLSGGFYWNSGYYIRPNIFFGGFHWGSRRLVVNHHYYDNYYGYNNYRNGYDRNIHISNYTHWSHNPVHRRGVRYPDRVIKRDPRLNRFSSPAVGTAYRSAGSNVNQRNVSVNKVQERLRNTNRTSGSTATVNRRQSTSSVNTTTRVVRPTVSSSNANQRNVNVNKVQERLSNTNRTSGNTATVNRRQSTNSVNTTTRVVRPTVSSSNANQRNVNVNKVQERLSNTNRTSGNTATVNRRQSGSVNTTTRTVRPTVSNRAVVNKSTTTNRTVNRTATPQRSTSAVTSNQRSTSALRQRSVNQNVSTATRNSSRVSATTNTSSAKAVSKPSTRSSTTTTKTTTTSSNTNNGKWSRR